MSGHTTPLQLVPGNQLRSAGRGNPPPYRYPPQCPRPHHHTTPTHRHHTHLSTAPTDSRNEHYEHPATTPVPPESAAQRTSDKQGHTLASRFEPGGRPPADSTCEGAPPRPEPAGTRCSASSRSDPLIHSPQRPAKRTSRTPRHNPRTARINRPTHAGQAWTDRRTTTRTSPAPTTRSTYPASARPRPVARTGPRGVRDAGYGDRDGGGCRGTKVRSHEAL